MSSPGDLIANKIVLPPVKRIPRRLQRRSALCSPDVYEPYVLPVERENAGLIQTQLVSNILMYC